MAGTIRERDAGQKTAARIRSILASRGLTLHQASVESERLYGSESPACIPHTLYHSLASYRSFGPSLAQTCALSRISGYRLEDWLAALGFDLDGIAGLQASLALKRTRIIDPTFYPDGIIADLEDQGDHCRCESVIPLGRLLRWVTASGLQLPHGTSDERRCMFARIGPEDALAFPELLPGSIVRVNREEISASTNGTARGGPPRLLLIEHDRGLWCGRFHVSHDGIIHASASELAYAQIAFRCPEEVRILGTVDMEIRWMYQFKSPSVPLDFARYRHPRMLEQQSLSPGVLVRGARSRAGLTLREASLLSRKVSQFFNNEGYAIAQSTLSEYEAQNAPPRHLEKVITLCLIYGLTLKDFAAASGTRPEHLGRHFMSRDFLPRSQPIASSVGPQSSVNSSGTGGASVLLRQFGDIPWFLRSSLAELSGIPRPSLRDCFWLDGIHPFLPAHTQGSMVALVNRRKKKPARLPSLPSWQQPAYVFQLRNGQYLCACCSLDGETLVLYPESDGTRGPQQLRLGKDAEVIGQIVALARHIASQS
jgi:hypothetical protein